MGQELSRRPGDQVVIRAGQKVVETGPIGLLGTTEGGRVDILGWIKDRPAWVDADPAARMNLLRALVSGSVGRGDMFAGVVTDQPVVVLTGADHELLPLPDSYVRLGICDHQPDAMRRFMAKTDVGVVAYGNGQYPYGRVLVLSTIGDVGGPIYFGSYIPRVRIGEFDFNGEVELFAYPDEKAGYSWKAMWAGPGWQKLLAAAEVREAL